MARWPAILVMGLLVSLTWFETPVQAQSPPTDLTELNIEEILALHIIGRTGAEPEDPKRWSVGYWVFPFPVPTITGDPPVRWMVRCLRFVVLLSVVLLLVCAPQASCRHRRGVGFSCG